MKFTYEHKYEQFGGGAVKPRVRIEFEMSIEEAADMKGEFIKTLSTVEEVAKRIRENDKCV